MYYTLIEFWLFWKRGGWRYFVIPSFTTFKENKNYGQILLKRGGQGFFVSLVHNFCNNTKTDTYCTKYIVKPVIEGYYVKDMVKGFIIPLDTNFVTTPKNDTNFTRYSAFQVHFAISNNLP